MDYLFTLPKAVIPYYARDMIIYLVSDAAYLVLPEARNHGAMLYKSPTSSPPSKPNGHVHLMVKTIHDVPASASEAKIGGIFVGAHEAVPILNTLIELGHPQPASQAPLLKPTTSMPMIFSQHRFV
jgi:hypothetical protein